MLIGIFLFLEFLDSSDTTLAFAVFGMTQVHTFPIAIFTVKNSLQKEELLLCYNGNLLLPLCKIVEIYFLPYRSIVSSTYANSSNVCIETEDCRCR